MVEHYDYTHPRPKIVAVDFDGILAVEPAPEDFPAIGEAIPGMINGLIDWRATNMIRLYLWTCRMDGDLAAAVKWCAGWGLFFDGVNTNDPERNARFGKQPGEGPRKIGYDILIDDRTPSFDLGETIRWVRSQVELAASWKALKTRAWK